MKKQTLYKLFVSASIIFDFSLGFFAPFWFLYAGQFSGGIETFSYGLFFMTIASAITAYFSGKIADRIGMRTMLIISGIGLSGTIFGYTLVESITSFYLLQALYGILLSAYSVAEVSYVAEITSDISRGEDVGTLNFFTQLGSAFALLIAGFIGARFGMNVIFTIASLLTLLSVIVLSLPKFLYSNKIKEV